MFISHSPQRCTDIPPLPLQSHFPPEQRSRMRRCRDRWREEGRAQRKRVSGAGFCSASSRSPSLATGRAIIINIICLHHSPSTFAFSCRYEDGMLINERGRHSTIRPVPRPPSAPSLRVPLHPSIPKRDGRPICFPASPPRPPRLLFYSRLLLFALKGTNSIHSYDKEALIEEWRE